MKKASLIIILLFSALIMSAQSDYLRQASSAKASGDYQKAADLYKKAIAEGSEAYYDIASLYDYNLGDEKSAMEWFRKGAEAGDPYCMGCLADALRDGRGVGKDNRGARSWYMKAAAYWAGSKDANADEYAFQYYQSAAKLGDVEGMKKLASSYSEGRGTAKNEKAASQWLARAEQIEATTRKQEESAAIAAVAPVAPAAVPVEVAAAAPAPTVTALPSREDSYAIFAKDFVESRINEWQKKDEFEKTEVWKARVEKGRDSLVAVYSVRAEAAYIANEGSKYAFIPGGTLELGTYDPDNEIFMVSHPHFGKMLLEVPIARAPEFKAEWAKQEVKATFYIDSDTLAIATLRFENPRTNDVFTYSDKKSLAYKVEKIDYNFSPVDFTPSTSVNRVKGEQSVSVASLSIGGSDVDVNIPEVHGVNDKTFAVVIGNENYQTESQVQFAVNDANAVALYCAKTLGLPQSNIHVVNNATLNNLRREINWLTSVSKSYAGEATVIFYYSGHGIPDEADKSAYLLPVDGYGSDVTTGYKLTDLYDQMSSCEAKTSVVMLDACFSGAGRTGDMMRSARGIALKADVSPKPTVGNMIIMSAATGDETAYPYVKQQHGMFTYFLLSKLADSKGNAKLGDIFDYVKENVTRKSIVENQKSQTPTVTVTDDLKNKWRNITFR